MSGSEGWEEGAGDATLTESDGWLAPSMEAKTNGEAETVVAREVALKIESAGDEGRKDVSRFNEETSTVESNRWGHVRITDNRSSALSFCKATQTASKPRIIRVFLATVMDTRAFSWLGQ